MKHPYLILFFLFAFLSQVTNAQTPSWQWINNGGSNGSMHSNQQNQRTKQIATDARGNIYGISPTSSYGITMDTLTPVNGFGYDDFVVFSYTCDGQFRWLKQFGSVGDDFAGGIIAASDGSIYVSGSVSISNWGDAHFGDSIIPSTNNMNKGYFLAKLDSMGNIDYLSLPGPDMVNVGVWPIQMEADNKGNPVVLTWFSDSTTWNGHHISGMGHYLVKFNKTDGNIFNISRLSFSYNFPNSNYEFLRFNIDGDNNIYLNSHVPDSVFIDNDTLYKDDSQMRSCYFLAKFNEFGQHIWHTTVVSYWGTDSSQAISGKPIILGSKVFVSANTQSYVGSTFMGKAISNPIASQHSKRTKVFASFNKKNGTFINAINLMSSDNIDRAPIGIANNKLVAVCSGGRLVIMNQGDTIKPYTNGYENFPFVVEIDTGLTHFNWGVATKTLQSNVTARMTNMHIDYNGNILLAGGINGAITNSAGDTTNMVASAENFFIAKVALTNKSCDCAASIPSIAIVSSSGNTLTVYGSASNQPDSLYILWGDGDSTLYTSATNVSHTYANTGPWNVCLRSYGFCGVEDTCLINLYSGISSEAQDKDLSVTIYPNPFDERITVALSKYNGEAELSVYDLLGKEVYQRQITSIESQLDLSKLKNGVYFLRILWEDGVVINRKIIKN